MIFCVEDDSSIRDIEVYTLNSVGLEARGFRDASELFEALKVDTPSLILLDIMLVGNLDGVQILKQLKRDAKSSDIPVIMATAKGMEYDKVESLDLGADDYLVKPFGMMEMVSRIKAVLRRSAPKPQCEVILSAGDIQMNTDTHTVLVRGQRVVLALKEYELLRLFLSHPGKVFDRDRLLSDIWGMDYDGETRTVDVHIRTLRQKLGDGGDMIETVRAVGYRLREEA